MKQCLILFLVLFFTSSLMSQSANFGTSLHSTRNGKIYWYSADTSVTGAPAPGFEALTNVPMEVIQCTECHGPVDADGNAYTGDYAASCVDCHPTANFMAVTVDACYNCHSRQKTEIVSLQIPDVHRDAGFVCWDCHGTQDIHGDGTEYKSQFEVGAIDADCENCHVAGDAPMPDHSKVDPHSGKIHCAACHAKTVISCYNCHFESQVVTHIKRHKQPIQDFVLLINRDKDNKVYPASFQSVEYLDTTFIAIAPYNAHSITGEGRTCNECHVNDNVNEYNNTGEIKFASWNSADSTLDWKKGVVPIPYDYDTSFKMDYITYTGALDNPMSGADKNWVAIGKDTWDAHQMFFATPLDTNQMMMLSLDFGTAWANFDSSLHATRKGKNYWYGKENGGFENWTDVPVSELGCAECHGPTDAYGTVYDEGNPYPGPSCYDCHGELGALSVDQCYGCHSRQKTEAVSLALTDVHRDNGMVCWDCHTADDMHGDGIAYNSMFEPGAAIADCENCHSEGNTPGAPQHANEPHGGKLHCTACHSQTVISCYNCHFESQLETKIKRHKQPITDFVLLVNREKDGKVHPASFQSVTYNGIAFVAFGPYTPHTTMNPGRSCTDCHVNFGGTNEAITQYNSGEIKFATWNSEDSTLSWIKGVVPIPEDYQIKLKMDFLTYTGSTSNPMSGADKNWISIDKDTWDGHQMFFVSPLTKEQMFKIGFDTTLTDISNGNNNLPLNFALLQNYPNPFNPATTIEFHLPLNTEVTMKIYNILGAEVQTIFTDKKYNAGVHNVKFDATGLASGIYFYQIKTAEFNQTKKMFLLK
jgi:hypothetical protein